MKLNRAGRLAAGHACFVMFHVLQSGVVHPLRMMLDARSPTPDMVQGLTPKERELIERMKDDLDATAETLRKLGWRLTRKAGG